MKNYFKEHIGITGYYVIGKYPYRIISVLLDTREDAERFIKQTFKKEAWGNYIVVCADNLSKYINWFEKLKWFILKCLIEREYYK